MGAFSAMLTGSLSQAATVFTLLNICVFAWVTAACIIVSFLRSKRHRRSRPPYWFALCHVGCVLLMLDIMAQVGNFFDNLQDQGWLFYMFGWPFVFLPILLRSWRVVCIYYPTYNWNFTLQPVTRPKLRNEQWLLIRLVLLLLPFVIAYVITAVHDTETIKFVATGLQGAMILAMAIMAYLHWRIREKLQKHDIDESRVLLSFSAMIVVYFIYDHVMVFTMMGENVAALMVQLTLLNLIFWTLTFMWMWQKGFFFNLIANNPFSFTFDLSEKNGEKESKEEPSKRKSHVKVDLKTDDFTRNSLSETPRGSLTQRTSGAVSLSMPAVTNNSKVDELTTL
eukprot:Colp12_sorted_trinity150504_noHs@1005